MKRSLLLFLLACLISACGARNQNGSATGNASGANSNAAATTPAKTDVAFAKDAVEGLLNGDLSAEGALDWQNLKVLGADTGATYRGLPDDADREEARKDFIEEFSKQFKSTGAKTSGLRNWREQARSGETAIIAVDIESGETMRVFITHKDGQQKVSEISVE